MPTEAEAEAAPAAVRWTVDGPVMHAVLDRPPANALGPPILDGLEAAFDAAADDDAVKIIVISSARPGFFAAGADIKHMGGINAEAFGQYGDRLRGLLDRLAGPHWIGVAAIEGLALGGGLELALACTLRVAGRAAKLGLPEVKLGLIPGAGGTQRLPRVIGRGPALDIMLTGRQVPADEAHRMGLVDRLVDEGSAADAALDLAAELAAVSLPAQRAVVRTVDASFDLPLAEGIVYESEQELALFEHGEAAEGITAFLEKRKANFK